MFDIIYNTYIMRYACRMNIPSNLHSVCPMSIKIPGGMDGSNHLSRLRKEIDSMQFSPCLKTIYLHGKKKTKRKS